jgi:hypothetical protein
LDPPTSQPETRPKSQPETKTPKPTSQPETTRVNPQRKKENPQREERVAPAALAPDIDALFDRFWAIYPERDGTNPRKPAFEKFKSLVEKNKISPEAIIQGAQRYAASVADLEGQDRKYIKQAITWLNQHGWKDQYRKRESNKGYSAMAEELLNSSQSFEQWTNGNGSDPIDADLDLAPDEWVRQ